MKIRVTIWWEDAPISPEIRTVYPDGIWSVVADFLGAQQDIETRVVLQSQPLDEAILDATDVLFWYGHLRHSEVEETTVLRVQKRVLEGMGFVTPHSGHFSKPFVRLMGTTGQLNYRTDYERETVWVVAPGHPIAQGLGAGFVIPREEVYCEFHDVPPPDELVFLSAFEGGEAFRSGCCWTRGAGRIFYWRAGHDTLPTYYQKEVQQVLINAVRWAAPRGKMAFEAGPKTRGWLENPVADGPKIIGGSHPLRAVLEGEKYR